MTRPKLQQSIIDKILTVWINSGGLNKDFSLSSAEIHRRIQNLYGEINFEYPVNPEILPTKELLSWGSFREDNLQIIKIAELAPLAQKIIDRVGW